MNRKERRAAAFGHFSASRSMHQLDPRPQGLEREILDCLWEMNDDRLESYGFFH